MKSLLDSGATLVPVQAPESTWRDPRFASSNPDVHLDVMQVASLLPSSDA